MAPLTSYLALLPILNQSCTTFKGPAWWLAEDLQFRTITEEEARLIEEQAPQGFDLRPQPGQKTLVLTPLPAAPRASRTEVHLQFAEAVALSSQLAFAFASSKEPLVIPCTAIVSRSKITRLSRFHQFEIWGDTITLRKRKYRIRPGITSQEVSRLSTLARNAIASQPTLRISFRRFCSALIKTDPHDKLLDLTIALESFIPGGGEFRFRFPYFLSLLSSPDRADRDQAFEDLRALYEARSALVHGSAKAEKVIARALTRWDQLLSIAKQCTLYRMHFEEAAPRGDWERHLIDLSYGVAPLI